MRAIVVGAGIAGLAAGYRLQKSGCTVTVLEAEHIVGGRMSSVRRDGYIIDRAASLLSGRYREMQRLADEVGVGDQLQITHDEMGFYRDGRVHRVRAHSQMDMVRTELLSMKSKLKASRLVLDARLMGRKLDTGNMSKAAGLDNETLRQYADRRLNPEIRDYIIDPTIRSLYGGRLEELCSVEIAFLIKNFLGAKLMNSVSGIDFLAQGLAEQLDVQLGARVTGIEEDANRVRISWERRGESEHIEDADICVVAVTAHAMAAMYPQLMTEQQEIIAALEYSTLWSISLGVDPAPSETAVFVQIPTVEHPDMTTAVFEHNKAPGRAPSGKGLLNSLWLTDWYERHSHLDDEAVAQASVKGLEMLLPNLENNVEFYHVSRWKPGLLKGTPGTWTSLARFHSLTPAKTRIRLAGDYLGGSTTNSALVSGERAASKLLEQFAPARMGARKA